MRSSAAVRPDETEKLSGVGHCYRDHCESALTERKVTEGRPNEGKICFPRNPNRNCAAQR